MQCNTWNHKQTDFTSTFCLFQRSSCQLFVKQASRKRVTCNAFDTTQFSQKIRYLYSICTEQIQRGKLNTFLMHCNTWNHKQTDFTSIFCLFQRNSCLLNKLAGNELQVMFLTPHNFLKKIRYLYSICTLLAHLKIMI